MISADADAQPAQPSHRTAWLLHSGTSPFERSRRDSPLNNASFRAVVFSSFETRPQRPTPDFHATSCPAPNHHPPLPQHAHRRRRQPFGVLRSSARCCPLAPANRSAPGLAINISRCVGRGRGSPGRSEAERRGPPSSGQVQSQISGASGQPVASRGCLAERAAARRPPEGGTPEHRSRIFNLSLRRPSGGVRLVVLLHGQRDHRTRPRRRRSTRAHRRPL